MANALPPVTPARRLYVVGIGASAGGLDAIERFFDNLPSNTGMAFVVVQHLSPDFKSLMDELLARHTDLPIRHVEDGMAVEPDHVYLIPPKKEMIISDGRLHLSERDRQQELSLPIDIFFRSLAQDCGRRAVAIVLSGGGSDGSRGIRAVHEAGGLVVVQTGESAQFDGMPKTARDAGVADWVLPPDEMPRAVLDHVENSTTPPATPTEGAVPGLTVVYGMLEQEFGIDFTHYKPSTVTRRIERRLQLSNVDDVDTYVERLKNGREELDLLYRDLLIGVTRFFRDEAAFQVLEEKVLPDLLQRAPRDAPLRVWVAGCATGEEVYSLAIVLHDLASRVGGRPVKIFATDVHHGSLEFAAAALYDEQVVANVLPERLERYFLRRGKCYQVVPELRQMVVFAPHNVIKNPPFTRVDLISCRNLLIYLQMAAQQKALSLFHFALNRGGVVFLGPSESPGPLARDFETIDGRWRIYRKYSDARIPVDARLQAVKVPETRTSFAAAPANAGRYSPSQLIGTYDMLLDEFMPPSLLVNDRGELIHAFSGASRFLKVSDGRQDLDVLEMVDPGLRMVLVGSLQRVLKKKAPIVLKGVRLESAGNDTPYEVTIRPFKTRGGDNHVLISLDAMAGGPPRAPASGEEIDVGRIPREQLVALEAELSHTKENLQAVIEELESSNEELQAANEELQTANEELQSTNEELQSVNEELYTVNAEYQRKISELVELTNDMDNLLSSTEVSSIFLDAQLMIRKFTPQVADGFKLLPRDIGRSIETFTHDMDHPELPEDLKTVLATGKRVEREVRDRQGRAFFLRILPYRAKGTIDGVVLTLIDVSGLKAAEDALFHERYLLNSLLNTVPDAIYFKDARGRFIRANHAMAVRLGLSDPAALTGKTAFELPNQEAALALHHEDEAVRRSGEAQHYRLEERVHANGVTQWDLSTRLPLIDLSGRVVGIIGIFRDVSEQKQADMKIQEAVRRRDQFLAMLSHELRNPLSAVVAATTLLKSGNTDRHEALLSVLDRQSQQMARLLDDLLEVSRVTQNKIELRKSVIDVKPVLKDVAEASRTQIEGRGIQFSMTIDPSPLFVDGDPARLQQIAANLLNNAAKYTPHGGHVALEAKRQGERVVISVRDDGAGIHKEMLGAVFDLFVQSNHTLDRAQGGLGVGLTLVRSLITLHGGEVTVHSDGEGKGSEFTVWLPLAEPPALESARQSRPGLRLAKGSSVVVVEDNNDTREILCEIISLAGFKCQSSDNGAAGLELIERVRPDVAIVDLGLPELDGFEVARRLRESSRHPTLYLIALTGYGQSSDRAAALRAGFNEHMVKPADPAKLLRLLSGAGADLRAVDGAAAT